jgi:hypothetical protein
MLKFLIGFICGAIVGAKHSSLVLFYFEKGLVILRSYLSSYTPM